MSSLAKQILHNKKKQNTDDLGLPLEDESGRDMTMNPQYFVARALMLEQKDPRYDPHSTVRLHLRENTIYQHNNEVAEDDYNFYKLVGVWYNVPKRTQVQFWADLHRRLPRLSTKMYKISGDLWWDKSNGEVVEASDDEIQEKFKEDW